MTDIIQNQTDVHADRKSDSCQEPLDQVHSHIESLVKESLTGNTLVSGCAHPNPNVDDARSKNSQNAPSALTSRHGLANVDSHTGQSEPSRASRTKGKLGGDATDVLPSNFLHATSVNSCNSISEFPSGIERYQIQYEIGRGGCGVVERAFDRQLQRDVVIKRVNADSKISFDTEARFLNEARITGQLEHPGIVPVHEIGRCQDDSPFYAMKWLHGKTLHEAIADYHAPHNKSNRGRQRTELLVRFHQVCQTLAYAHGKQIIHRDLKPANIIIGSFGETVVLDWGLAKRITREADAVAESTSPPPTTLLPGSPRKSHSHTLKSAPPPGSRLRGHNDSTKDDHAELTQQGAIMGTAAYMSPEQARGDSLNIGLTSDVFSLGVILYEILSGDTPFRSDSVATTLSLVARAQYSPLDRKVRGVDRALSAICQRAMQLDPAERYPSAAELAADIRDYLAGESITAYREPWWAKLDRLAGKYRVLVRSTFLAMFAISMVSITATTLIHQARMTESMALSFARDENRAKESALQAEQAAHDETLNQLQLAREAVDRWLVDLSGELQFFPGMQPLRAQLLDQADQYFASRLSTARGSWLDIVESARADIRLGDIHRLKGDVTAPEAHYLAAYRKLDPITADTSSSASHAARIQSLNAIVGLTLCRVEGASLSNESIQLSEQIVATAQKLLSDWPEDREAKSAFIRAHQTYARLLAANGRYSEAIPLLQKPLVLAEWLMTDQGNNHDVQRFVDLLNDQATYHERTNEWEAANELFQRLVRLYSQRLRTHGQRADWLEARSHARVKSGGCLLQMLNPQSALEEFTSAQADLNTSWEILFQDPFYRENLAITHANLGSALLQAGAYESADSVLQDAIIALQQLVKQFGADNSRIKRVAQSYLWLAKTQEDQATPEQLKLLTDAGTLVDHLMHQADQSTETVPLKLEQLRLLSQHWINKQQWREALTACESAEQLLDQPDFATASKEGSAQSETLLLHRGRFKLLHAAILFGENHDEEAKSMAHAARETLLQASHSHDAGIQFAANIAWIASVCDDPDASDSDLQSALTMVQQICNGGSKHPVAWHWLSVAAWRNQRTDLARQALRKTQQLRTQTAWEDRLMDAILSDPSKASNRENAANVTAEWTTLDRHNAHCEFLIRSLSDRAD